MNSDLPSVGVFTNLLTVATHAKIVGGFFLSVKTPTAGKFPSVKTPTMGNMLIH